MRLDRVSRAGMLAFACAGVLGTVGCNILGPDAARDARQSCEKKQDGSACFTAGTLVVEKSGEVNADAVRLFTRGCAMRNTASCEALGSVKGPMREQALVDACNGGDLVSCARRASDFGTDPEGQAQARVLRHSACKQSTNVRPGMSAREIEGIAESCAALAKMIAAGEGGGKDAVAAAKLEVLAATLRSEALYQHEREDDAKILPHPAQPQPVPVQRKGGIKREPKPDPTAAERAKFRREYEARRAARDAWLAAVDASFASSKKGTSGDPTYPTPSAFDRAASPGLTVGGPSSCQTCVDGCGSINRCGGDDFVGGRCGHLRGTDGFDTCVAECTAKADACVKACGDCNASEAAPPAPPPAAKGGR